METQRPEPTREPRIQQPRRYSDVPEPTRPLAELAAPFKYSAANQTCWALGVLLITTGLVGYVVPGIFSAHLNPAHNLIFLFTGLAALILGVFKPNYVAKKVCYWLGGFYTLMGIAGFAFGIRAVSLTRPTVSGVPAETEFLWKLIPGRLELGTVDHGVHIVLGLVFIAGALLTLRKHEESKTSSSNKTWH